MYKPVTLDRREEEREAVATDTEIYLESSVFKATLVDVSEGGVRFEMLKPINFLIRFKVGEKRLSRRAQMVWTTDAAADEEGITYGFRFIKE